MPADALTGGRHRSGDPGASDDPVEDGHGRSNATDDRTQDSRGRLDNTSTVHGLPRGGEHNLTNTIDDRHPDGQRRPGDTHAVDDLLTYGQRRLGDTVTALLDADAFPVVLGGGHEVAYGTYLGLARSARRTPGTTIGILNLDAHFDLRPDPIPSSGTPFRQILESDDAVRYAVLGISQPSNTTALFDTAHRFGVRYLLDDDCEPARAAAFVAEFLTGIDLLYLTIDLDVLPASVAPGVSAPAAFGVPLATIQAVCDQVTASGMLTVVDVAELSPGLDIDDRTARTAARLIHRIVIGHRTQK
ncbi:arginase family protein [Nocardia sp. NPDC058176]|uniref:arginase family protein n=1 Tax=Nocardia sp. NPDC058176 TaxID=3346368 RepID=UPI0036DD67D5